MWAEPYRSRSSNSNESFRTLKLAKKLIKAQPKIPDYSQIRPGVSVQQIWLPQKPEGWEAFRAPNNGDSRRFRSRYIICNCLNDAYVQIWVSAFIFCLRMYALWVLWGFSCIWLFGSWESKTRGLGWTFPFWVFLYKIKKLSYRRKISAWGGVMCEYA